MIVTQTLRFRYETPGKYRYDPARVSKHTALDAVYIRKESLGGKPPKQLTITITD
jgi:hypothetical protein